MSSPYPRMTAKVTIAVSKWQELQYGKRYDKFLVKEELVNTELKQAFAIAYGQVSDDMKESLKEFDSFDTVFKSQSVVNC